MSFQIRLLLGVAPEAFPFAVPDTTVGCTESVPVTPLLYKFFSNVLSVNLGSMAISPEERALFARTRPLRWYVAA